jgi:hypothetical protein
MKKYIFALALMSALTIFVSAQNKPGDLVKVDDDQSYLVLSTKKLSTMEKELDEAAAKGFRVLYGAPTQQFDMALFLKRNDAGETPYDYKIMATIRLKTMEKELNEFAAQGYRLLPRTLVFKQGFLTAEMVMLMERAPKSGKAYEYKLVNAGKETKLHTKIDASMLDGFAPVTMITIGEHIVVMEKESALKQ